MDAAAQLQGKDADADKTQKATEKHLALRPDFEHDPADKRNKHNRAGRKKSAVGGSGELQPQSQNKKGKEQ